MNIAAEKRDLRTRMSEMRAGLPLDSRIRQSAEACRLAEDEVLGPLRTRKNKRLTVFSYLSFRDEPDTGPLLRSCLKHGDRVLVPRVVGSGAMKLHKLSDETQLVSGAWGIPEPDEHVPEWPLHRYAEIDLVIVPGLAFDRQGGRIGFGGGYYDRFIAELQHAERTGVKDKPAIRAAIAFQEQIVPEPIPVEEHDFRLDMLFTASGTIYI
ncbi:5-formyltetrahydrofolate cyclo-ligase [Paenibacillus sp. DYY-L-2]|uniref:5-formyltetrahydrofolate cyclo-ligase n=1 Tax=Paenibacillus sp. DYY-L-2 TaxID=3447013 RepID=UPI003F4F7891